MHVDDTGEPGRTVTTDRLLDAAENAFLRAEFNLVRPLLRRIENEFGTPTADDAAARYAVLRCALAARADNWPEAVRRCPSSEDLECAATGVVHTLAVSALRRLGEDGLHADAGTAALAIVLWAYLLHEEDLGDFRGLLTGRRGTPVPDELWKEARRHLLGRITDLLHALDVRSGRDVIAAWETAWAAERLVADEVVPSEAGSDGLIPLEHAARHLVRDGRHLALLDAYTARHPDPGTWTADSPDHRACADVVARALAQRGRDRVAAAEWSEALADFSTAARLGRSLDAGEQAAVLRAGKNVGRSLTGRDYSPIARIHGLELAHTLLAEKSSLAPELAAELVRQGRRVLDSDPVQSRNRFARALAVSPRDRDARSGLDDHLRADLLLAVDGTQPRERIRVDAVKDLLRRDPDCVAARRWLQDHYVAQAVTAASGGRTSRARSAVRGALRYSGDEGPYGEELVDNLLVDLLVGAGRFTEDERTRARLERRVGLMSTAVDIAGPADDRVREERIRAVLELAEHLEADASPSDVIELFLRDHMPTGVSARFDQTVETAYLRRAQAREKEGDLGGARRDRACAERLGAGLLDQGVLFGPAPGSRCPDDLGQDPLF
ncbi:hypothetical protein OIB37_28205 [Streptomyces sp. NBC_00820]|uniref:hypothetical protein n=1 Tax=Streptomyces sp. NBC_00820 TaxID=2975842 RepID=UPI002ED410E1|nr:hypothetical protein OIB37_28205 [Streptomyces sp. NBC_00820]